MSENGGSPLIPEDGDVEEALEAEVEPIRAPDAPRRWQRWAAVILLAVLGAASFATALLVGAGLPSEGNAATEALASALTTIGASTFAAAVTLAAVVLTLGLQREQEQNQRWADFQVEVLREAYEWLGGVYSRFGAVIGALHEWGSAVEADQHAKLDQATQLAQRFYDEGQQLGEVERLERLVADRGVRRAIRRADGAIRSWNEMVAGDHTTREVRLIDSAGAEWDTFSALGEAHEEVRDAYAKAVRDALVGE